MSTIKVNKIENTSTTDGGVSIDNDGHVTIDGQQLPTAGPLSNRNLFFNGACEVNQRGTVSSSDSYGGPDRFILFNAATAYVAERSQQVDAPANTGLQKCYQLKTTTARTGATADEYIAIGQFLEFKDIYNAIWAGHSHVTISFWVKSSIAGTFAFNMNPCNTDSGLQNDRVLYHTTYTINSADTWEYKAITIPMAGFSSYSVLSTTDGAQVGRGLELTWPLGISSGGNRTSASTGWNTSEGRNAVSSFSNDTGFMSTVNATFKLTGIQFEVGSKSTPFEHRSYGDELAKCQRYLFRVNRDPSNADEMAIGTGHVRDGDTCQIYVPLPVQMRSNGQSVSEAHLDIITGAINTNSSLTSSFDEGNSMIGMNIDADTGTPWTEGRGAVCRLRNVSGAFFQVESEL